MIRWIYPNTHISRSPTMPDTTLLDIPEEEQAQMLAALRRASYGYLLALHVLLLCAAGRNPTDIAAFLFCSRSSVYRIVRLYRARKLGFTVDAEGQLMAPVRTTILMPWMKRALGALLKVPPRTYGWCRTRWSCATLAAWYGGHQALWRLDVGRPPGRAGRHTGQAVRRVGADPIAACALHCHVVRNG